MSLCSIFEPFFYRLRKETIKLTDWGFYVAGDCSILSTPRRYPISQCLAFIYARLRPVSRLRRLLHGAVAA